MYSQSVDVQMIVFFYLAGLLHLFIQAVQDTRGIPLLQKEPGEGSCLTRKDSGLKM